MKNKATLICGANGTGKTTFCIEHIIPLRKRNIIVSCSNEKKYATYETFYYSCETNTFLRKNNEYTLQEIQKKHFTFSVFFLKEEVFDFGGYQVFKSFCKNLINVENTNIVFDDLKYLLSSKINDTLKSLFVGFRQNNCNVFSVYHTLNDVHVSLLAHYSYMVLFKTNDKKVRKELEHLNEYKKKADKQPEYTPLIVEF